MLSITGNSFMHQVQNSDTVSTTPSQQISLTIRQMEKKSSEQAHFLGPGVCFSPPKKNSWFEDQQILGATFQNKKAQTCLLVIVQIRKQLLQEDNTFSPQSSQNNCLATAFLDVLMCMKVLLKVSLFFLSFSSLFETTTFSHRKHLSWKLAIL